MGALFMKPVHPVALFRLSVLGPLVSRQNLARGELKAIIKELALKHYDIPGSRHTLLSEKTIEAWYYAWKKQGVEALEPKRRIDRGQSKIPVALQAALIKAKQENPKRSLNTLLKLVQMERLEGAQDLSRSSVYRLLLSQGLSRPVGTSQTRELRRFEADYPGDIIYGDVMHGPKVVINGKTQKAYLVSLMDDKSRLILHSAFCPGETALDIEYVLKQALLRRGLPKRLVIDNGAAYRSHSLQGICARLSIELIYCRPYAPEGKGKLERWHRTLRDQFLTELQPQKIYTLDELNGLLWAWIDQLYHPSAHSSLKGKSPLAVWQNYLEKVQPLGTLAHQLDELFYHRIQRKVRKDGTISYEGQLFEVPYCLSQKTVTVVIEPHHKQALYIEDEEGKRLGDVTPLDCQKNRHYKRASSANAPEPTRAPSTSLNELALKQQEARLSISPTATKESQEHSEHSGEK
jgi:transposase InsO family protein